MKNLLILSIFTVLFCFSFLACSQTSASSNQGENPEFVASNDAQSGSAHLAGDVQVNFPEKQTVANLSGGFISNNWGVLTLSLLAFAETIVRLTPSEKDNSILKIISTILNSLIPNLRKGGGVF